MVRTDAMRPTLATSRQFSTAIIFIIVLGFAVILRQDGCLRVSTGFRCSSVGHARVFFWLTDSERLIAEPVAERDEILSQLAVFAAFLMFYSITAGSDTSPFDAHVRQAVAFVHGHVYIEAPNYIEHAHLGPEAISFTRRCRRSC